MQFCSLHFLSWSIFDSHPARPSVMQAERSALMLELGAIKLLLWFAFVIYWRCSTLFWWTRSSFIINVELEWWDCDWNRKVISVLSSTRGKWVMLHCPTSIMMIILYSKLPIKTRSRSPFSSWHSGIHMEELI